MRKIKNLFEAVLEGAYFYYKKSIFGYICETNSARKFESYTVFENENTIALVKRYWTYLPGKEVLSMGKDKRSLIFSKKTNRLYYRNVYKSDNGWKTAIFGLSFLTATKHLTPSVGLNRKLNEFTEKVAEATGVDPYNRDIESILLELKVGCRVRHFELSKATYDLRFNECSLQSAYDKLRKGEYYAAYVAELHEEAIKNYGEEEDGEYDTFHEDYEYDLFN